MSLFLFFFDFFFVFISAAASSAAEVPLPAGMDEGDRSSWVACLQDNGYRVDAPYGESNYQGEKGGGIDR